MNQTGVSAANPSTISISSTISRHFRAEPPGTTRTHQAFDTALWARIEEFAFDPPGARRTFAARLADKTGWAGERASRAVQEYRRFLYLAVRAGHPVTPSKAVDEVWHLHLLYTRHYWGVLCGEVLGRPLHHGPSLGGAAEAAKFEDWYTRTRDSYTVVFGEAPDTDIWPSAAERFAPSPPRAVDTSRHWIIAKPSLPAWARPWRDGAALGTVVSLAPMAAAFAHGKADQTGSLAPVILVLGSFGAVAAFKIVRWATETPEARAARKERERQRGDSGGGCGTSGGCGGSSCGGGGCGGGD